MRNPPDDSPLAGRAADPVLVREVADLVVSALNLDIDAAEIDPNAPLYGEGLGLDSIDILEIALVASKRYGFKLNEEERENMSIFSTLNNLTLYIAERRTK
jgi:acyl carrier protein